MLQERDRPGKLRAAQDRALVSYLRRHVGPYSTRYGSALRDNPVRRREDLGRLPFTRLADVVEPGSLVLRPTPERIAASGDLRLVARMWWARLWGRLEVFNRRSIEPVYKTLHWHRAEGLPIGYSAEDLDRLGEVGRVGLEMAGLGPYDVLVSIGPPGPHLSFWQLALGARRGGVSAMFLGPATGPRDLARLAPTAVAGRPGDLARILQAAADEGHGLPNLHTLVVVGDPLDPSTRRRLTDLASAWGQHPAVVSLWAPAGVRALWAECRGGVGLHTWPGFEVIELVDPLSGNPIPAGTDGEIVWSPIGWKGSVVLRLRTATYAALETQPCPGCGRTSPRLNVGPTLPPFARLLEEHPGVAAWQAELRIVRRAEELIVFLTPAGTDHPGPMLRELDRQLSVTQFVVLPRHELDARLLEHDDARVIDLRR